MFQSKLSSVKSGKTLENPTAFEPQVMEVDGSDDFSFFKLGGFLDYRPLFLRGVMFFWTHFEEI